MKEINGYSFLEVPEGSSDFSITYEYNPLCVWLHMKGREFPMPIGNIIHPAKKVEIIGLAKDLTEEQWKGIVHNKLIYEPVERGDGTMVRGGVEDELFLDYIEAWFKCHTATESGHSLLKANNLNPDNCLILKKIL